MLIVPVPFNNVQDIHQTLKEPYLLLPHPSRYIPVPAMAPSTITSSSNPEKNLALPASASASEPSISAVERSSEQVSVCQKLVSASTQTEEEELDKPKPKQVTRSAYAQTAHSCFPSFIPMTGPKTFKRHKKTLAIQTHAAWPQDRLSSEMATSETQTLCGQGSSTQTQTILDLRTEMPECSPSPDQSVSSEDLPQFDGSSGVCSNQQLSSSSVLGDASNGSTSNSFGVHAEQTSSRPDSEASEPAVTAESNTQVLGDVVPDDNPQPCSVDSISNSFGVHAEQTSRRPDLEASGPAVTAESNTQVLGDVVPDDNSQPSSIDSTSNSFGIHTEQTSRKSDSESSEPAVTAESNSQVLGDLVPDDNSQPCSIDSLSMDASTNFVAPNEVLTQTDLTFHNFLEYNTSETQTFASVSDAMTDTSETPAQSPEPTLITAPSVPTSLIGNDQNTMTAASDLGMSGLDLLFLASTEHRANASLDMSRMDDSSCCQETQTGLNIDTGHQETQTVWDWSLDEFSFLDQYTQTAQSATAGSSSVIPETDQFSQTGMGLYSQFTFSNMETQTVSVFDLEMFGNSISVQTESESESVSNILGGDGLTNVGTQVQVTPESSQQEMVSADVQTEALDFRLRSKPLGSSHLASSQTQTSFWEDIESIIRSDSFTQTLP